MGKRKKGKQTGGNDEDNNVNADCIPAASREIFQKVHEILVKVSELEIYAMLVECNMDENEAINRLLDTEQHSDHVHAVEINQGENSIQNSELGNGGGHDVDQEQGISNRLAALSTTCSILVPPNSDITNGETKNSDEAVPSLSVPSSSELTNVGIKRVPIRSGKKVRFGKPPTRMISNDGTKMVDVLKRSIGLSPKETVTEANSFIETDAARDQRQESASEPNIQMQNSFTCPDVMVINPLNQDLEATVKDDSPLYEKPDATNPSSQTDAARDQLGESAAVSNQNMRDEPASEANIQMQNSFACPGDIVLQYPYKREKNSQCLNSFLDWSRPTSQSIPTPSSMTERQVPSNMRPSTFQKCVGRNNNNTLAHVMNSPNSRPEYNNIPASSAFQQHDGTNNNTYFHYRSPESMFSQYRNSNLLQSNTSIGPSAQAAQQQIGEFSYSHWRSPNFRPSQQEQQSYTRIGDERSSTTSQNQQNSTSNPSHQTQQGNNGYGEEDKH